MKFYWYGPDAIMGLVGRNQQPDYPIVPHEVIDGVDCDGCLVVDERCGVAVIRCNVCRVVVATVLPSEAGQVLSEIVAGNVTWAICPHCRRSVAHAGMSVDAYICPHCEKTGDGSG